MYTCYHHFRQFERNTLHFLYQELDSVKILTIHFNQSYLYKKYYFNIIIIWTMYNIYEIFYLIALYKPDAANRV